MKFAKYKMVIGLLACGMALAFGVYQFAPTYVAALDKIADSRPHAVTNASQNIRKRPAKSLLA
jgi:hypothetical protein